MNDAMTLFLRRWLSGAAGILAVSLLLLGAVPASALETPAPVGGEVGIFPSSAAPGDEVGVWTTGWKPGTQLQAVVCGQLAVGGSTDCDLRGAVTATSNTEGEASHTLTLQRPPSACPCVVRVSTFSAPALAVNVPVDIQGHRMKVVPEREAVSYDLRVENVEMHGRGGFRGFLGLGGRSTMEITLANRGDVAVKAPAVAYGLGRGDIEPTETLESGVTVPAGGTQTLEIEISVPLMAFGTHQAVAQWADGAGSVASAGLTVYPFGALILLLGSVAAAAIADLQRHRARDREGEFSTPGAHRFLDDDGSYPLPDVVYLEDIGGYLVKPVVLKNSRVTKRLTGRVRVSDLALLVESDDAVASYPDGTPAAPPVDGAGGGLRHLLWWERNEP